jgi:hypothetical protein
MTEESDISSTLEWIRIVGEHRMLGEQRNSIMTSDLKSWLDIKFMGHLAYIFIENGFTDPSDFLSCSPQEKNALIGLLDKPGLRLKARVLIDDLKASHKPHCRHPSKNNSRVFSQQQQALQRGISSINLDSDSEPDTQAIVKRTKDAAAVPRFNQNYERHGYGYNDGNLSDSYYEADDNSVIH